MKISSFFLSFFICFLLFSSNAACLVFSGTNAYGINEGNEYIRTEGTNLFIYTNGSAIFALDYAASTTSTLYSDLGTFTCYDAYVASNGYLYFATNNGVFKRIGTSTNPLILDLSHESANTITISTDDAYRLREEGGYIYYMCPSETTIKRFSLQTGLTSEYLDYSSIGLAGDSQIDFDIYNGDVYILFFYNNRNTRIYKNLDLFYDEPFTAGNAANLYYQGGIQVIDSNKIYFGQTGKGATALYHNNGILNSTGAKIGTWDYPEGLPIGTRANNAYAGCFIIGNLEGSAAGVKGNDIEIVETTDIGRTISSGSSSVSSGYLESNIESLYDSYYNNSALRISYNVKTDALNFTEAWNFKQDVRYRIDLLNPDGVSIDSRYFYASEFEEVPITYAGIIFISDSSYYQKSGSVAFTNSNNWINGTYTCKLWEINDVSGSYYLMDSDTLEVLPEQLDGIITPDETQESMSMLEIANSYISSSYTWGAALTLTFGGIGAIFAGSIGFIVGSFLGVCGAVAIGLFPSWVVVAIIIVSLFALTFLKD